MKFSPSKLDAFSLYLDDSERTEWMTKERLIAQLTEPFTISTEGPAAIGTGFHQIMECETDDDLEACRSVDGSCYYGNGFEFDAKFILDAREWIPADALREMWSKYTTTSGHVLWSRIDAVSGNTCHDYKTSARAFNPAEYQDKWQWKVYLASAGCNEFRYHLFQYFQDKRTGILSLKDQHHFALYAYPDMVADIENIVDRLAAFVTHEGIADKFAEKK